MRVRGGGAVRFEGGEDPGVRDHEHRQTKVRLLRHLLVRDDGLGRKVLASRKHSPGIRQSGQPRRIHQLGVGQGELEHLREQHDDCWIGTRRISALLSEARQRDGGAVLEEQDGERHHGNRAVQP